MPDSAREIRRRLIGSVYSDSDRGNAEQVVTAVEDLLSRHLREPGTSASTDELAGCWSQDDVWLITYADQFQSDGEAPLATLDRVLNEQMSNLVNGIHILPFYPWSSDDGFSVLDYLAVDERYGTWDDVERLSAHRRLMVDAVINHISAGSDWFQRFRAGEQPYDRYFYCLDPDTDTGAVVRPRTHPLLTKVETVHGPRWV
ncbi:MAG: alpha-amylase family glycosyl hydrolase, partial [Acidimicrobiia bacterium]|nr:alpha-amylase family glycosyl hydrolase [Acidimicrobiia bacterium]